MNLKSLRRKYRKKAPNDGPYTTGRLRGEHTIKTPRGKLVNTFAGEFPDEESAAATAQMVNNMGIGHVPKRPRGSVGNRRKKSHNEDPRKVKEGDYVDVSHGRFLKLTGSGGMHKSKSAKRKQTEPYYVEQLPNGEFVVKTPRGKIWRDMESQGDAEIQAEIGNRRRAREQSRNNKRSKNITPTEASRIGPRGMRFIETGSHTPSHHHSSAYHGGRAYQIQQPTGEDTYNLYDHSDNLLGSFATPEEAESHAFNHENARMGAKKKKGISRRVKASERNERRDEQQLGEDFMSRSEEGMTNMANTAPPESDFDVFHHRRQGAREIIERRKQRGAWTGAGKHPGDVTDEEGNLIKGMRILPDPPKNLNWREDSPNWHFARHRGRYYHAQLDRPTGRYHATESYIPHGGEREEEHLGDYETIGEARDASTRRALNIAPDEVHKPEHHEPYKEPPKKPKNRKKRRKGLEWNPTGIEGQSRAEHGEDIYYTDESGLGGYYAQFRGGGEWHWIPDIGEGTRHSTEIAAQEAATNHVLDRMNTSPETVDKPEHHQEFQEPPKKSLKKKKRTKALKWEDTHIPNMRRAFIH